MGHLLLWDGECGFCQHMVEVMKRRDRKGMFKACQFQLCPSPPMHPELYEGCKSALYVITEDSRELRGAKGVLFLYAKTGWSLPYKILSVPPLLWLVQFGYWLVARNRGLISRIFFKNKACGLDYRRPE